MMAWVVVIVLAAIGGAGVLARGRPPAGTGLIVGAMLALAVIGYGLQGSPTLPAAPRAVRDPRTAIDPTAVVLGQSLTTMTGSDGQWLAFAAALIRQGQTQTAVVAMRSALTDRRNSPDLWVGLGNALVAHSGGLVTPAALLAYRQAQRFSPDEPAALFYVGLAGAQAGRTAVARDQWTRMLRLAAPGTPWRAEVTARRAALDQGL